MASNISPKGGYPKRDEENPKPGGTIKRGCGRGDISRPSSSSIPYFLRSRIREAFMGSSALQMTKLTISNLDYGITDSDMYEYFSRFGPLKFAKIQCNKSGRSLGYADVLFERRSDAIQAMKHSNGVPLEGRKMDIQFSCLLEKPSLTDNSNIRSTSCQRKNKRKCRHKQKRALRSNDDEVEVQLEECMKAQLVISEST